MKASILIPWCFARKWKNNSCSQNWMNTITAFCWQKPSLSRHLCLYPILFFPQVRLLFGMRLFNLSTLRVNDDGLYSGSYFWVCRQNPSVWHSNATSLPILSHSTIFLVGISHFWEGWWINSAVWPFKWNLSSSTFTSRFFSVFCKIKSEIMSKFDLIHFRG